MMRAKRTVMSAWRTVAIAVVALSALSAASAQNLVQDPSFETTQSNNTYGFPPTTWFAGQSFGSTAGGNISGTTEVWVVTSGSIDLVNVPGFGGPPGSGNDQFVELNGNDPGAISQAVTISQDGIYEFSFYYGGYAATADGLDAADDYVLSARARIVDSSNNVVLDEIVDWRIADAGGINGSWIDTPYTRQIVLSSGTYYVVFESLHFGGVRTATATIFQTTTARVSTASISRWCQSLRRWSRWARV
jgi:hypothetical protein